MVARLMVGEETLTAGGDPFDRPVNRPRRPRHQYMLGIDEILGAKAAADIRRDKPHRRRGHAQCASGVVACCMNALARHIGCIPAGLLIPHANDAAQFHRVGDDAVIVEAELDDMGRPGEGGVDCWPVAGVPIETDVAWRFCRDLRRV